MILYKAFAALLLALATQIALAMPILQTFDVSTAPGGVPISGTFTLQYDPADPARYDPVPIHFASITVLGEYWETADVHHATEVKDNGRRTLAVGGLSRQPSERSYDWAFYFYLEELPGPFDFRVFVPAAGDYIDSTAFVTERIAVPAPGSLALVGIGLMAALLARRKPVRRAA